MVVPLGAAAGAAGAGAAPSPFMKRRSASPGGSGSAQAWAPRNPQPQGGQNQGAGGSTSSRSSTRAGGAASSSSSAAGNQGTTNTRTGAGQSSSSNSRPAPTSTSAGNDGGQGNNAPASSSSSPAAQPSTSETSSGVSAGSFDDQPGGSAKGILTDPASYTNKSRIVLRHNGGGGQLIYTMPITLEGQTLNVQVDTGTSDMWLASTNCRTSSCTGSSSYKVALFDPRNAPDQRIPFSLNYVNGAASGTIRTANITVEQTNLTLTRQAFGSANVVNNEPMDTGNFTGILGIGPPAGSTLQQSLYDNTGNENPLNDVSDASSTGNLVAGLWTGRPLGARYITLGLQRLPSEGGKGDSVLTISQLDPAYASNASQITYSRAVGPKGQEASASSAPAHWSTYLTQLEIDVGGQTFGVPPGGSLGTQYPIATFSSGAPVSLAPASVLNVIYGAYGYQPGSDGGYYVPCDLMMNITLYLGDMSLKVPIHPLDASIYQVNGDPKYCFGGIQSIDGNNGQVDGTNKLQADFVIGAPFMRSVYTVFSCDDLVNKPTNDSSDNCIPRIGIKPMVTDMADAQHQFYQVRVLKQSLGADPTDITADSKSGLTPGLKALIGVLSAVAGIAIIMVVVLFLLKRQRTKQQRAIALQSGMEKDGDTSRSASFGDEQAAFWSEAQIQKAREVHRMHGVFDEDELPDPHAANGNHLAAGATPDFGANSANSANRGAGQGADSASFGVMSGSSPYYDARRIKAAYMKRHPSFELKSREEQQQILSSISHEEQQQLESEHQQYQQGFDATLPAHPEEDEMMSHRGTSVHTSQPSGSSAAHLLGAMAPVGSSGASTSAAPAVAPTPTPAPPAVVIAPHSPVLERGSYGANAAGGDQQEHHHFLSPAADIRTKPAFYSGPSPVPSPQRSTDDLFEGSQPGHQLQEIHYSHGEAH